MVDHTRQRVAETRERIDHTREIVEASRRVFERNVLLYREAMAMARRRQELLAESRARVQRHAPRRVTRWLRLLISARIDERRLPDSLSPVVSGVPGFGGECAACDGYMPATRMVMAIPHDDLFLFMHADCYVIWRAQCQVRALLRPFE